MGRAEVHAQGKYWNLEKLCLCKRIPLTSCVIPSLPPCHCPPPATLLARGLLDLVKIYSCPVNTMVSFYPVTCPPLSFSFLGFPDEKGEACLKCKIQETFCLCLMNESSWHCSLFTRDCGNLADVFCAGLEDPTTQSKVIPGLQFLGHDDLSDSVNMVRLAWK